MINLRELVSNVKAERPYNFGLRVNVAMLETTNDPASNIFGIVCDSTTAVNITGQQLGHDQIVKLQSGNGRFGILLRNFGYKNAMLNISKSTRISRCPLLSITEDIQAEIEAIKVPLTISTEAARKSPVTSVVSISGELVKDESAREVTTKKGDKILVRNLRVKDDTGEVDVTLWRDVTKSPIKAGDHVDFHRLSVGYSEYKREVTLQSTDFSKVQATAKPMREFVAELIAVDEIQKEEVSFTVIQENKVISHTIPIGNLKEKIDSFELNEEMILQLLPIKCVLESDGNNAIILEIISAE